MIFRCSLAILLFLVFIGTAETTARLDDWLRSGYPVFATPDRERDLVLHDQLGIRGKPNGRYKQWRLNTFGFRNGEMTQAPPPDVLRIMALGASETFGLFEPPGKEYPSQLTERLNHHDGRFEVVNAAVAGLTLRGIIRLWDGWASRFDPRIVLVYPTPAFYLGERPPDYPGPPGKMNTPPSRWAPRIVDRARDRFEYPAFIQRHRVRRALAARTQNRPADWFFHSVPADRLDRFKEDLRALVLRIEREGADVILLTHATAFHDPPLTDEIDALDAWHSVRPKAAGSILLTFEAAARKATLEVAAECDVSVVDAAAHLGGRRQWFADDFLHFNQDGARVVAELIAGDILRRTMSASRRTFDAVQ
jgi:lysophospholipase L1-like esterase